MESIMYMQGRAWRAENKRRPNRKTSCFNWAKNMFVFIEIQSKNSFSNLIYLKEFLRNKKYIKSD